MLPLLILLYPLLPPLRYAGDKGTTLCFRSYNQAALHGVDLYSQHDRPAHTL